MERLGSKRLNELMELARSGWGFEHCREMAAHFAWIWGRNAGLDEEEIKEKLRELNDWYYEPL